MWQAGADVVEALLLHHPGGAGVRNNYGSLPLHLAASNDAGIEVVKLLVDAYPDALRLQNDDGMTPLDLAAAGRRGGGGGGEKGGGGGTKGGGGDAPEEAVVALLEGRPLPPDLTHRQKAERYMERADELERRAAGLRGSGGRKGRDLKDAVAAVRRLADCYPQALYSAGIDPNELEIALSNAMAADATGTTGGGPGGGRRGGVRGIRGMPRGGSRRPWRGRSSTPSGGGRRPPVARGVWAAAASAAAAAGVGRRRLRIWTARDRRRI
jgi:hypothetical protein